MSLLDRMLGTEATRAQRRTEAVVASLFVLFLFLAMMAVRPYNHDDEQYVTAGVLARHLTLYRDFAYTGPPIYPLLLSAVFGFLDGHYYLAARLVSFVLALGSAALGWFIVTRITGSARAAVLAPLLLATSTTIQSASGSARNDILPCALMLGGISAVLLGWEARRRATAAAWMLLAGVLAAFALSTKQTYVFVAGGTLLYLLLAPRMPHRATVVSAFLAGGALGAAVDAYYLLLAPETFTYLMLRYHVVVATDWYTRAGLADQLQLGGRLSSVGRSFVRDGVAPAAILCLVASVVAARRFGSLLPLRTFAATPAGYLTLLWLFAIPCSWVPNPSYPQYWVATFVLGTLVTVSILGLHPPATPRGQLLAATVLGLGMSVGTVRALTFAPGLLSPESWVAMRIHADGMAIRAGAGGRRICVATLSPVRPLDAGLTILPELSVGPFLYRSAEAVDRERLDQIHGTSPALLPELLDRRRPGAILVGFEEEWAVHPDEGFRAYARERGFRPGPPALEVWYGPGTGVGCVS